MNPIEDVTLLAKSLERSTSTSIPKTSGSTETDQLLQTIQRNNQQIQTIVTLMDKVANGNLDVAPLQGTDRLSTTFQKLLSKISESINAKEELDQLKAAVSDLKMSVSGVRSGNLDVDIRNDYEQTRGIAESIKYLVENLVRLIESVQEGTASAETAVTKVEDEIGMLIERDEVRVQELAEASVALKQVPNLINKITEDLMGSAKSARNSIEKARIGNDVAQKSATSVSNLRKLVREDVKRLQNLNERSHDIERVAKTVEDLANRTNMIALNASIQATELGEDGHGFVLVAEEVERLAARANGTNKQISTLNNSILAEIGKVENSVETTKSEVSSLSKYAVETGNALGEMERYVAHFLNLQENLIAYSKDQSEETDEAFSTFASSISETETTVEKLKSSSNELGALSKSMRDLKLLVGEFRLPEQLPNFSQNPDEPDAYPGDKRRDGKEIEPENEDAEYNTEAFNAVKMDSVEFQRMTFDDDVEEFQSQEDEEVSEGFDSLELAGSSYLDEYQDTDSSSSVELDPDEFDSVELAGDAYDQVPDAAQDEEPAPDQYDLEMPEEPVRNDEAQGPLEDQGPAAEGDGVLDLYNASLETEEEETQSVFDSGEYSHDELIDESEAIDLGEITTYNAPATTSLDADELEDMLEPDAFDDASHENEELTV